MSWTLVSLCLVVAILYLWRVNRALSSQPPAALAFSPDRWTTSSIEAAYSKYLKTPINIQAHLPPKTGHRYVVVGGSGFLGGWVVVHLLARGEDPRSIRVLDVRKPTRKDLITGAATGIDFLQVDISNAQQVERAFSKPWPAGIHEITPLTVIHTAANIRFYERVKALIPRSARVNVDGTRNLLDSAQAHSASYFIYTSSGSVAIKRARYWIWPWQSEPTNYVQVCDDTGLGAPKTHEHFFSNYAYSKSLGERLVRDRDNAIASSGRRIRTGCLRPGNGVYGPGGDINVGAYLVRKMNPTWIQNSIQSECYVENASLAHLLYERRLIDHGTDPTCLPDLGGQFFTIADPNPPVSYGDIYQALSTLSKGQCVFPRFEPVLMLLFAHCVELYHLLHFYLTSINFAGFGNIFSSIFPPLGGDVVNLQPSLFPLTSVHLLLDDSRARLPPKDGGLGYNAPFTTLQGICKVVHEHELNGGQAEGRQHNGGGGVSFGFWLARRAERAVEHVAEKTRVLPRDNN